MGSSNSPTPPFFHFLTLPLAGLYSSILHSGLVSTLVRGCPVLSENQTPVDSTITQLRVICVAEGLLGYIMDGVYVESICV